MKTGWRVPALRKVIVTPGGISELGRRQAHTTSTHEATCQLLYEPRVGPDKQRRVGSKRGPSRPNGRRVLFGWVWTRFVALAATAVVRPSEGR